MHIVKMLFIPDSLKNKNTLKSKNYQENKILNIIHIII